MSITISGAGCSLIDYLYTNIDFGSESFLRYASRTLGDGGLTPGKLAFADEFEKFSGVDFHKALLDCSGGKQPDTKNLGGPAIVALINAGQIHHDKDIAFNFYGTLADDDTGHLFTACLELKIN